MRLGTMVFLLAFFLIESKGISSGYPGAQAITLPPQPLLSAKSDGVQLSLTEVVDCPSCPSLRVFVLTVQSETGESASIRLENPTAIISEIHVVDRTRGIILGEMARSGISVVSILDFEKKAVIDYFLCYQPTVSPNHQYIAYIKHYVPYGPQNVSDKYLVYDAKASPLDNRPTAPLSDIVDVGVVVYPIGSLNLRYDNINLPDDKQHFMASSFSWLGNDNILAFADRQQRHGDPIVVVADMRQGLKGRFAFQQQLIPRDMFDTQRVCPWFETSPSQLRVTNLGLSEQGDLALQLRSELHGEVCGDFKVRIPGLVLPNKP